MHFSPKVKLGLIVKIALTSGCILVSALKAQNCANASVGFIPLTDLGSGEYQGFQGGLYPNGSNEIPSLHLTAGLDFAQKIIPLDSTGNDSFMGIDFHQSRIRFHKV